MVHLLLTALAFIVIFSLLILIHELGHFVMAKRAGIKVEEFGFGLPPRIWGKKKGETIYSINWIPFGGFVRMLGESGYDSKMLKKKRSFVAQPLSARIKVVIAGVVMNFFLAWLLLTIGFSIGMKPLLGPDDVLPAVSDGVIQLEVGARISKVEEGSVAEKVGLQAGDLLFSVDGNVVSSSDLKIFEDSFDGELSVLRDGTEYDFDVYSVDAVGLKFGDVGQFPRVMAYNVSEGTLAYDAGIREGDYILSVNGEQIFSVDQFFDFIGGEGKLKYELYRDGHLLTAVIDRPFNTRVIVTDVLEGTPAFKKGVKSGDIIVSVNGVSIHDVGQLIDYVSSVSGDGEPLEYLIDSGATQLFYDIIPENGKIGVVLSELVADGDGQGLVVYDSDLLSSVVNIKNLKFPWYKAPLMAFKEGYKMTKGTFAMFGNLFKRVVSTGELPNEVSGPVGIAQMTSVFVNEGLMSLLRFTAVLSLSLAVLNILPFPGLDGGRLLFLLIEFVLGRRVNQKLESSIHALGYVLLLLLIILITYSDILRLVQS